MDHVFHAVHAACRQRFQELATAIQHNHAAWREAVRVHDRARQAALIRQERAILADVFEVMADFQATRAQYRARE